jgi:CubicO group peptidase (beta-lactamase class C family)
MRALLIPTGMLLVFLMLAASGESQRSVTESVDVLFRDFTGTAPGASMLVLRDGKVIFKKAYGLADLEANRKATPRTNYRLASVTKQFTAACILMLAERGRLSLDDSLTKFFPEFPIYGREIRVRHLLSHTSGVPAYEDLMPEGGEPVLDADVLAILKKTDKPYFSPGTQFSYSNPGYALLALIVEQASSFPFPEFLRKNIFVPLIMRGSHVNLRNPAPDKHRAFGYSKRNEGWERTDQSRTSYVLGDGGIYSSVEDLEHWIRAIEEAKLLNRGSLEQAMSAAVDARPLGEDRAATARADDQLGYGFGWFVSHYRNMPAVWHGGSTIGFRNHILRLPEKRLTVIVLTNRNDADAASLARKLADLYLPM